MTDKESESGTSEVQSDETSDMEVDETEEDDDEYQVDQHYYTTDELLRMDKPDYLPNRDRIS